MSEGSFKKGYVAKIILSTVVTVGLLGVAVVAPNAIQSIELITGKKFSRKKYLNETLKKMLGAGLVMFKTEGDKKFLVLTKKGKEKLLKYELNDFEIKKPKRWDGKWRVVIFDIKEKQRSIRDLIRGTLERLGFVKLQNSVWVFPYDCEELVFLLKSSLFVGKDVLYMKVDKIENDGYLRELYDLI